MITYQVNYAQSLIEQFDNTNDLPQIAISVDMLDTGIDVPDVVNLVFFKPVRSKVKFLQMIGRGTRLRPDLFGPGEDKTEFRIFDYCENFEFFNEQAAGSDAAPAEPLHKRLFLQRLELLTHLQGQDRPPGVSDAHADPYSNIETEDELRDGLTKVLNSEVLAMNLANFIVRPEREHVERFQKPDAWDGLSDEAIGTLTHHVAGLSTQLKNDDIAARLFDLTCLNLQIATLDQAGARRAALIERIQNLAHGLEAESAANIPEVKAQLELIHAVQSDEYWQDATLPMIENLRRRLRGLIQYVPKGSRKLVYSALDDEMGEAAPVTLNDFQTGVNLAQYRRKVESFIRANEQHVAIAKLKHNRPLTPSDLAELEQFVYDADEVGGREQFEKCFGDDAPLTVFIRSLVGLDDKAAKDAFTEFIGNQRLNVRQINFVEMIVAHLTRQGIVQPERLYEPPFTGLHDYGLDGIFHVDNANKVIDIVRSVNANARDAQRAA